MEDLVFGNGEITIRISREMIAQKSERDIRELIAHFYANYYRLRGKPTVLS